MSVSLYLARNTERDKLVVPVCGQNEAEHEWLPVCRSLGLDWIEVALTAGLFITQENYDTVLDQIAALCHAFEQKLAPSSDPVKHCRRVLAVLRDNTPVAGTEIYIG